MEINITYFPNKDEFKKLINEYLTPEMHEKLRNDTIEEPQYIHFFWNINNKKITHYCDDGCIPAEIINSSYQYYYIIENNMLYLSSINTYYGLTAYQKQINNQDINYIDDEAEKEDYENYYYIDNLAERLDWTESYRQAWLLHIILTYPKIEIIK